MMVLVMLGRSVLAAARMARVLWPWTLGLLALDLVQSFMSFAHPAPAIAAVVQGAAFGLAALLALRFYTGHLDVDWRAVLGDQGQIGRFVLWYCFLGLLQFITLPQGLAGHMPAVAALVCRLGAYYFSLRLIAILPAVVAWRAWPGVDRIWNAGGTLAWRIAALWIVVSVVGGALLAAAMLILHVNLSAFAARMQHMATMGGAGIGPGWLALLAVATCATEMISFAFDVACFRVISGASDARPKSGS